MADQALFAYQVALPDGTTTVRTGGADRPPTHGELADYAANQGERYLGPVEMSPAIPTGSAPTEAPPTPPPAAPAVPPTPAAAPVASPDTFGQQLSRTFLPVRSFASQVPSMVGGFGLGTLGAAAGAATGPFAPIAVPLLAMGGAALGSGGLEYLQAKAEQEGGVAPSEAGTPGERATRAGVRGLAGEGVAQGLGLVAQGVKAAAGPTLRATEALAPTLTRELPPEGIAATTRVGQLIRDPAQLAAAELTPQGQQTVLSAWWQHHAPAGADAVVNAWDALGEAGQGVLAGPQRDAMSTMVNAMRGGKPLMQTTMGDVLQSGGPAAALWHYGVLPKEVAVPLGFATKYARENAPRLLTRPTVFDWASQLPQISRVASPWASLATSAGGQVAAREALPAYTPETPLP
jgi:hypothetical protein